MDSNVQPGVGKFGCIWLEWFARGQGIWLQIFEKSQIPTLCPASPTAGITLIGALRIKQGENENDTIRNRISDFDKWRIPQPKTQ